MRTLRLRPEVPLLKGLKNFSGAPIKATDLRAGATLILTGLSRQKYNSRNGTHSMLKEDVENIDKKTIHH